MIEKVAIEGYQKEFGEDPQWVVTAPGRINIVGEHTDYTGGYVLPCAIHLGVAIAAGPAEGLTELFSEQMGQGHPFNSLSLDGTKAADWSKYPAGVAAVFGGTPNVRAYVASDLPIGMGVSSSAALEVAFGTLYSHLLGDSKSPSEIALIGQRAENEYVGVRCGIMDQFVSANGRANHALHLDTKTLAFELVSMPKNLAVVLCDPGAPRELATSAYNIRRNELEEAERRLGKSLRDTTLEEVLQASTGPEDLPMKRATHVVSENVRTFQVAAGLKTSDRGAVFEAMKSAHESMRDNFEASSYAQDRMAEAIWQAPGVWGGRMTGGGFGGACVALVEDESKSRFIQTTEQIFADGVKDSVAKFIVCSPADGAELRSIR